MIDLDRIAEALETEEYDEQVVIDAIGLLGKCDRSKIYVGKYGMANLDRYLHEHLDKGLYPDSLPRGYSHIWDHNTSKTLEYSLLEGDDLENKEEGIFHTDILKELKPPVIQDETWYEQPDVVDMDYKRGEKNATVEHSYFKTLQEQLSVVIVDPSQAGNLMMGLDTKTKQELWLEDRTAIRIEEDPVPTSYFSCVDKEIVYLEEFNLQLDVELIRINVRISKLHLN